MNHPILSIVFSGGKTLSEPTESRTKYNKGDIPLLKTKIEPNSKNAFVTSICDVVFAMLASSTKSFKVR